MGDTQVGCAAIQKDLKRSNELSVVYLCPAKGNPKFSTWGGITSSTGWANQLEGSLAEKDLRALMDKVTISQKHTLIPKKATSILGCISIAIRSRKVLLPLHSSLSETNLECCI